MKGGINVGVDAIHKLKSVVQRENAELGVLVCINPSAPALETEATSEGEIGPLSHRVLKLRIVTVEMLFQPHAVLLPGCLIRRRLEARR